MTASTEPIRVGGVVFPGFELLDLFGPLEMFGMLEGRVRISILAELPGSVASNQGPACVADASLKGDHRLDVLLVPGGFGTRREVLNLPFLADLKIQCEKARFVASVCTGSALLAKIGVLDGRNATSNKRAFRWAASHGPNVEWVTRARWVEDGKYFTSSGVSAGMDMALGLIAHIFDRETSLAIAGRAEYAWHEDKGWDPFAALNGLV
jgi:putative intracellular protease/amidase